jgi:hypothetical protein
MQRAAKMVKAEGRRPDSEDRGARVRDREADLARLARMAFGRLKHCGPLVKRFHELKREIEATGRAELIWKVYDWLLVPFMMWPEEFEGMAEHLLEEIEERRKERGEGAAKSLKSDPSPLSPLPKGREGRGAEWLDEEMIFLLEILPGTPPLQAQEVIAKFERDVESGRYEGMLKQRAKYEEQERALLENKELMATWAGIRERFDVSKFQNARGVIRRRVSGERNFREGWEFDWSNERSRFQHVFDAMCYRWNLYGMEYDRPLLLKLTANPTAHGTLLMIPSNFSFDPHRDVDWRLIAELHRVGGAGRQGPKLSSAKNAKLAEARQAKRLREEAGKMGKKGEGRYEYVREKMGRDLRADEGWLWRLLRQAN